MSKNETRPLNDFLAKHKDIPYFELVEIAVKERNLAKRAALFKLSNEILKREFMKAVRQNEQKSVVE